ncbi:metal-dependent hydrolase [Candidatus Poribacteria bacterium]|nr:metal-dependent hydrolase [Candidatus Poribacteria bacterium]
MGDVIVKWHGHANFQITSANGKNILIDPWFEGNPSCSTQLADLKNIDYILVTHDHFDHMGNAVDIALTTKAMIIGLVETAAKLQSDFGVPQEQVVNGGYGMNIGGTANLDGIKFTLTQAFHSSASGSPCGFIVKLENGKTIYHSGDTGIFATMATLGDMYKLDLALLPIGSVFTMDPFQAAHALTLLKPKAVIPMHYQTFPILEPDASEFLKLAKEKAPGVKVVALNPGEEYILK